MLETDKSPFQSTNLFNFTSEIFAMAAKRYCSALWCSNFNGCRKDKKISFFGFPKDMTRAREWAKFCLREDILSKDKFTSLRICSEHFSEDAFLSKSPRPLLKHDAWPSITQDKTSTPPPGNEDYVFQGLQGDEDTCHVKQEQSDLDISEPFTPPLEDDQHEPQRNRNPYHLIEELPELYMSITLPYLEKEPLYLKWVYDVIKGEAERERVVYESPCKDDKNGFVMIRDSEWDGEDLESLHLVALPYRPGLLTIRDLRDTHLILLKNIYNIGKEVVEERYGVPGTQLNIYLQYLPSFYHLNIHFKMLRNETCGFEVKKNHLLPYVINILELCPDYYQKATLMLPLEESHNLFLRFKEHGIVR